MSKTALEHARLGTGTTPSRTRGTYGRISGTATEVHVPLADRAKMIVARFGWKSRVSADRNQRLTWSLGPPVRPLAQGCEPHDMLRALRDLRDGWDGEGAPAPSASALAHASKLIASLYGASVSPDRVLAMPEGGVSIYCFGGKRLAGGARTRYAWISIQNSGNATTFLNLEDRESGRSDIDPVRQDERSRAQMAELVADFLSTRG